MTDKPVVEVKSIDVQVGKRTLTLTLEEAKELRRVLDDVLKSPAPATPLQLVNIPSVWCEDDLKNIPPYTVTCSSYSSDVQLNAAVARDTDIGDVYLVQAGGAK